MIQPTPQNEKHPSHDSEPDMLHPPSLVPPPSTNDEILSHNGSELSVPHTSQETPSLSKWGAGRDRRQLSEEGYRALAICATFLAAIQSQVVGFATVTPTGKPIPVASAIFLLGLLADVFGAILSLLAARWFEMLTEEEANVMREHWDVENGVEKREPDNGIEKREPNNGIEKREPDNHCGFLRQVDRWVCMSLRAGPYLVFLGLVCLILGLVAYASTTQHLAVLILACVMCAGCMTFVITFHMRHDRKNILARFRLRRRSDAFYL